MLRNPLEAVDKRSRYSYCRCAMRVVLAGYNVDAAVLEGLKKSSGPREDVTPETLSASYARISRDPRPADKLRAVARAEVARARRSNETIIFKMGHHSVAEHAVFNFDIIGVSRLAIEEIERFRLCSFTEKSQRYITLGNDFVIPAEIKRAGKEGLFVRTVRAQNALYHRLLEKLLPHVFEGNREMASDPRKRGTLEGWAKEDARYAVSLATEGQLGLTINARNLELLIRRFAAKDSAELRRLNGSLYRLAKKVAPSIILFTDPSDFDAKTYAGVRDEAGDFAARGAGEPGIGSEGRDVRLVDSTPLGDRKILAALLHTVSRRPHGECLDRAKGMTRPEQEGLVRRVFQHMEFYDFPLREFEHADLTYALVLSASCFAQLKRHRMATLTCQDYDPGLGVTIPPSIREIGAEKEFLEIVGRTEEAHEVLRRKVGRAADYVLTNAHRRRALLKLNVRELYHVSRLREDATAQWEIRRVSAEMARLAKKRFPLATLLLGAKDRYSEIFRGVFGRPPKVPVPPVF
jgi:flavin-dependent thymidylate synthase